MRTCEKEREKLADAEQAASDAWVDYEDQQQAAGEATFFSWFHRLDILSATIKPKTSPVTLTEKSMSALEKQGTAERAQARVPRARRAAERASRSFLEAREVLDRCLDAREMEPVSLVLKSTLTLRARFLEEKILPPAGLSGTLPMRETTDAVEARCGSFERLERGVYRAVTTLDDVYTAAPHSSTVFDDRGRPTTHTLTEQVTAVTPGRLVLRVDYENFEDPYGFSVRLGSDAKPLRSGQQTFTVREPDTGCHTTPLPYSNVPSDWPDLFNALRRKDEDRGYHGEIVIIRGWTWREQGDLRVATRRWSAKPGPLVTSASGEVILVAEHSSMEVTLRRRAG